MEDVIKNEDDFMKFCYRVYSLSFYPYLNNRKAAGPERNYGLKKFYKIVKKEWWELRQKDLEKCFDIHTFAALLFDNKGYELFQEFIEWKAQQYRNNNVGNTETEEE